MCEKEDFLPNTIAALAVEALLFEAAATPKPGLVDRVHNGAHDDMNFFTFQASAAALSPYFLAFVQTGRQCASKTPSSLLAPLQSIGQEAERAMLQRTHGVNTHKGAVFSFGLLLGASGYLYGQKKRLTAEAVAQGASQICAGLCAAHFRHTNEEHTPTKGEVAYLQYGLTGARGEAEAGFPLVLHHALPLYRQRRRAGMSGNDALVDVLCLLMAKNMDTNVLGRRDMQTLRSLQTRAARALRLGGMGSALGREAIAKLDAELVEQWVSPGGSADLVAVTHFLYKLELCSTDFS